MKIKAKIGIALFVASILLIVGCATGVVTIEDLNIATDDLQKVIVSSLPVRARGQSVSGREFKSAYFVQRNGEFEESDGGPTRSYVIAEIIGDRRPYSISVQVVVEKRTGEGHYTQDRADERLARVISRRIQKALHERREDRNIIDDFRAF